MKIEAHNITTHLPHQDKPEQQPIKRDVRSL